MDFYTCVLQRGNKVFVQGYHNGKRERYVENYKPYLFLHKQDGTYKTIDGRSAAKIEFDSIKDARDFLEKYEDVSNMEVFGMTNFAYPYIYDNFQGEINYDPSLVRIGSIDIEVGTDEASGFPNVLSADKEITAIALKQADRYYVFGCGTYIPERDNITYIKCKNEMELLAKFIAEWQRLDLDIITGWNIEFFDIPYLINRIVRLLGMGEAKKLSPWGIIVERDVKYRGKEDKTYDIFGIANLDYYKLYRKFTFGNKESYKLDYIAQIELEEQKVDYSEYGSLIGLYKKNYQKFISYNIHDADLVGKLEDKLKFIELVMAIAYDAKINYNDTFTTVRPWDVIIHNYLMDHDIVVPPYKRPENDELLIGGFVKEPKIGMINWPVSFDLTSLYPSLIQQYNISPEKMISKNKLKKMIVTEKQRRGIA